MPTFVDAEIGSQPDAWRRAAALARSCDELPKAGESVAIIGCGTSWYIALAYAAAREAAGHGRTDAFAASEIPRGRRYDRLIALSRSGTTSEVVWALEQNRGTSTLAVSGVEDSPVVRAASASIVMPFADERSVVQTRFATTALTLLRRGLGHDVDLLEAQGRRALTVEHPPVTTEQVTFIGRGPAYGLALEAALKAREAAQLWTEAYPAMDYRHGPIAIAQPGRVVWILGAVDDEIMLDARKTGATVYTNGFDPQAELVVAQRFAVAVARHRGLDPDLPRALTRSVILSA